MQLTGGGEKMNVNHYDSARTRTGPLLVIRSKYTWKAGADHLPQVLFLVHFVAEYSSFQHSLEATKRTSQYLVPELNQCPACILIKIHIKSRCRPSVTSLSLPHTLCSSIYQRCNSIHWRQKKSSASAPDHDSTRNRTGVLLEVLWLYYWEQVQTISHKSCSWCTLQLNISAMQFNSLEAEKRFCYGSWLDPESNRCPAFIILNINGRCRPSTMSLVPTTFD
jgi:hypothetical protein